jgi:hypothetical protein
VRYVVLCAFGSFEVWEPGRFPTQPRRTFTLAELPDFYDSLAFIADLPPTFLAARRELTTEASERTVALYRLLNNRGAHTPDELQRFILQTVWCLFASSLGMLPGQPVRKIVASLRADDAGQRSSAAELGHLYTLLNTEDVDRLGQGGVYADSRYVNGGLFAQPARVHLEPAELDVLAQIADFDWGAVEPTIFGSLIEGFLPRERGAANAGSRSQFGVHYTHESDIMKIVGPSIVDPWTERLEGCATPGEAEHVLQQLCDLIVLDPACGCGNFLYVAYRELRELEAAAKARIDLLAHAAGIQAPDPDQLPHVALANIRGIELDPFAVRVTRLVLWMGHKLAADRHGAAEPPLPLPALEQAIVGGDALKLEWPQADVIIGNPPFNGSQHLRGDLGKDEVAGWSAPSRPVSPTTAPTGSARPRTP